MRNESNEEKIRLGVLATYREEHKRLKEINTELFAACIDLLLDLGSGCLDSDRVTRAHAAIAKAEGAK